MQIHQRWVGRNLAKTVCDWREVIHAVILDRLAELIEPFSAGFSIGRGLNQNWQQLLQRAAHGTAKRAR
jgi:hypothetical protein